MGGPELSLAVNIFHLPEHSAWYGASITFSLIGASAWLLGNVFGSVVPSQIRPNE